MNAYETGPENSPGSNDADPPQARAGLVRKWVKQLFICNPFFLVSAALLLLGINRLSVDPAFLNDDEAAKLVFNFRALQLYEGVLIGVAVLLGRRRIWYDSTLLVFLDSMLTFVPFILISHAGLFSDGFTGVLAITATLLAIARFAALKKFLPRLNLPPQLLVLGGILWLANLLSPFAYHQVIRDSWTTAWEPYSQMIWFLLLPILASLAQLLPRPSRFSPSAPTVSWLPMLIFWVWVAATGAHAHCVDYMSELEFHPVHLLPTLWILGWTAWHRLTDFHPTPHRRVQQAILCLPAVISLLGVIGGTPWIPFVLCALNTVIYSFIFVRAGRSRLSSHLIVISIASMVWSAPDPLIQLFRPGTGGLETTLAGLSVIALTHAFRSPRPWAALIGAVAVAGLAWFAARPSDFHLSIQVGLVFGLLHSLSWTDANHPGARGVRFFTANLWVIHSFLWARAGTAEVNGLICGEVLVVLAVCFWRRRLTRQWPATIVPVSALLSLAAIPAHRLIILLQTSPVGLVTLAASFVLLGVGTLLALSKARWHPTDDPH